MTPDSWNVKVFRSKVLFCDFETVSFESLDTLDGNQLPLEYALVLCRHRESLEDSDRGKTRFERVDWPRPVYLLHVG
jgi:hypothetical protein